jgi:hypothetical protein
MPHARRLVIPIEAQMFQKMISISFVILLVGCSSPPKEKVIASALEGTGRLKAEVLEIEGSQWFGDRYYLRITNTVDSTSFKVERDLLEGRGGYESGIVRV